MTDRELELKVTLLQRLLWLALVGLMLVIVGVIADSAQSDGRVVMTLVSWHLMIMMLGAFALAPFILYAIVLSIWHWKARYKGKHSYLWGGILVMETSGWSKLVYLLRHVIPDAKGIGRYARKD
jgi:hypothetical protein